VFVGNTHLDDATLIRRYLAERGLDALEASDESDLRHLVRCESCEARYVALQRSFDDLRHTVVDDADAAFSDARLAEQRDRILRRIDAQYEGPRVLPFPAGAAHAPAVLPSRTIKTWIAAAAVASFIIGLTAGQFFHIRRDAVPTARNVTPAIGPAHATPSMRSTSTTTQDEDDFLSEVDMAAAAPGASELRAIYEFTMGAPREATPAKARPR